MVIVIILVPLSFGLNTIRPHRQLPGDTSGFIMLRGRESRNHRHEGNGVDPDVGIDAGLVE
jgi:hypothetical protein